MIKREVSAPLYSQSTSRMTSISENEMNICIPLCNVWYLNGFSKTFLEILPKNDSLSKLTKIPRYLVNKIFLKYLIL